MGVRCRDGGWAHLVEQDDVRLLHTQHSEGDSALLSSCGTGGLWSGDNALMYRKESKNGPESVPIFCRPVRPVMPKAPRWDRYSCSD